MSDTPKVVQFSTVRANVPAALRRLADRIEAGKYGDVRLCGVVIVEGASQVAAFAYGSGTDMEFTGAFIRASMLACSCLREIETEDDDGILVATESPSDGDSA